MVPHDLCQRKSVRAHWPGFTKRIGYFGRRRSAACPTLARGRASSFLRPRRDLDSQTLEETIGGQCSCAVGKVNHARLYSEGLRFEQDNRSWLDQDSLALWREFGL